MTEPVQLTTLQHGDSIPHCTRSLQLHDGEPLFESLDIGQYFFQGESPLLNLPEILFMKEATLHHTIAFSIVGIVAGS